MSIRLLVKDFEGQQHAIPYVDQISFESGASSLNPRPANLFNFLAEDGLEDLEDNIVYALAEDTESTMIGHEIFLDMNLKDLFAKISLGIQSNDAAVDLLADSGMDALKRRAISIAASLKKS